MFRDRKPRPGVIAMARPEVVENNRIGFDPMGKLAISPSRMTAERECSCFHEKTWKCSFLGPWKTSVEIEHKPI